MSEWRKTIDSLPENNGSYVVIMKDGHDNFGCFRGFFNIATFSKVLSGFYYRTENITDDVEYWMPLPKPPEKDSE